jgi:hypothetical protein
MHIQIELITPLVAERYLNMNVINRKLRSGVVEKYAEDMRNGNWTDCVAPISFYADTELADGQHRLYAVIESDTEQTFIVVRGVSRPAGLNIDTGLGRDLVDNAKISGIDSGLSTTILGVARAIANGQRVRGVVTNARRLEFVAEHREATEWAVRYGPKGKFVRNALMMGAVGRAFYHVADLERLKRFSEVVTSGYSDGAHESAAVTIRNHFLTKGAVLMIDANWRESFLKAQNAIAYFMRGRELKMVKVVNDEAYPLPNRIRKL